MNKLFSFLSFSLLSCLLSVLSSIILARILSVEDRGNYQLLLMIVNFIAILSSGGVGFAIVQSIRKGQYKNWERYLSLSLIISLFLAGIACLYYDVISIFILIPLVVLNIFYTYTVELSKAELDLRYYKKLILLQPLLFVVIYSIIYLYLGRTDMDVVTYGLICVFLIQFMNCVSIIRKISNTYSEKNLLEINNGFLTKTWLKQNLLQVFGFTTANIDKFIISFFLGNYTLGLYSVGMAFELLITRIMSFLVDYYYSGLVNNVNRIRNVLLLTFLISISSVGVALLLSDFVVKTFFGERYLEISPFIVWFVINSILSGFAWILTQNMLILGKQMLVLFRQSMSLVAFVISFIFLKDYELYGIVYSLLISNLVRLSISFYYYRRFKLEM